MKADHEKTERVAVITGAGKGIGRAIALKLACSGIKIVIADIDERTGLNTAADAVAEGTEAAFFKADVSDTAQVAALMEFAAGRFGRIDILVNNAGILSTSAIEDVTEDEWERIMSVNVKSVMLCTKHVLDHMKKQKWGRIINIASVAGRMGGFSSGCAYAASKAAVIGLTRNISRRMASFGITVNAIAPGTIESDMSKKFTPDDIVSLVANIPAGKLGKPEQVAAAVEFLASEGADFITGAVIDINGGMFTG
ncbi:MAG: 3-oxoacyl-ACP reductase FabG [Eubacteriales bacterium]|nr:3-oxoacyl-ACP reductase FabG [Eubacteriales bacterium]